MATLGDRVAEVAALKGRIHPAATLSALMAQNALAQVCPAAFILPLGIGGGKVDAVTGMYRQEIDRLHGVLLAVRGFNDPTGAAALQQLEPLIEQVIERVVGFGPEDNWIGGTYRLAKGELISLSAGTLTYQLDFAIEDQLRFQR
ncbi:MAG: hypothetical protein ACK4TC_09290 [Sphingomonas pseudosanguinis]|uniref:phage tail terminator protein n=1 Tax=Sphingomonas pseudosanguinis TaxID=413712 RepID=UPI00391B2A64